MHFRTSIGAVVVGAALMAAGLGGQAASAETTGNWYYLQGTLNSGPAAYAQFGSATDTILVGDWNGDGKDTLMIRRDNVYYVTNSPTGGTASYSFKYGSPGDVVIVGDWNGDGKDTLGVRRGNDYYLTDATRGGIANHVFKYGSPSDQLVVGDWNGDGRDTFGVRRGNEYYLTNTMGGTAQVVAKFGSSTDTVIVGDWNRDNRDSLGVRRGNQYYLANSISGGRTDVINTYGSSLDTSYVGDWNGDGVDTIAVRRPIGPPRTYSGTGTYAVNQTFKPGLYRSSVASGGSCYWERASDFSGSLDSIIANNFLSGPFSPVYTEVKSSDVKFETDSCATWTEVRSTDAAHYLTIDDGEYRVGKDIEPGTYQAPGGTTCYWERSSSFDHELGSIIANDYGVTGPIVSVDSTDFGFVSDGCGTWTRIGAAQTLSSSTGVDVKAFDARRQLATSGRP